jgi:uncharacterized membrane protein YhaH (DUF805 family)
MNLRWLLFSFRGRLARSHFWLASSLAWLCFAMCKVFIETLLSRPRSWLLIPVLLWVLAALSTKRLHDLGKSAFTWLWLLVPAFGPPLLAIELVCRRGTPGDNQYGAAPLTRSADYFTVSLH